MTNSESANGLPPGKTAGVCLHITSLPGPYGIGEIGEAARRFVDAMRDMNLTVWRFLPTGPTAYGDSPYQPLSTFAGNELLIDVRDLIEKGLLGTDEAQELAALPQDHVDYGALIPIKTRLLRLAACRFEERAGSDLKAACDRFVEENNELWLHDYALYRILKTQHGERPWPQWSPRYAQRDAEAMAALEASVDTQIADIKVIQFLFFEQWGRMREYAHKRGIRLFGGMPICIALDSADAWAHPEILKIDEEGRPEAVAAVPPDYFSGDGRLWGNALYDWDRQALHERHNIPGMGVLQFDVAHEDFDLHSIAPDSVCYTGTHDNDTTIGWFHGSPGDTRSDRDIQLAQQAVLRLTGGTADTVHTDLIRVAFSSNARLAIAPIQDFLGLGSEARINTPGTSGGNWRWRLIETQLSDEVRENIASMVSASGRAPAD